MVQDIIDLIFLNHRKPDTSSPPQTPPSTMSASPTQQTTCPVDHKSREAWLEQAKAAATPESATPSLPPSLPRVATTPTAESCPVDHGARTVWMQQARATSAPAPAGVHSSQDTPSTAPSSSSWSSYVAARLPFFSTPTSKPAPPPPSQTPSSSSPLGVDREVSTIPRASAALSGSSIARPSGDHAAPAVPANGEGETGADGATGNWIYPSERMFFEAMKRKGHDPRAADMRTVVPIHNAVNERAWAEIKAWEGPWIQGSSCDGPRLHSFSGLSTQMSPKARFNTLLGYQAPFDRHDWVVDRCGKEIEYVIDFYAGRNAGSGADGKLSFYLDVRPKLNSWEGIKMRAFRAAGLA
ncbi:cytochrome c/c1 heme-lyase [Ustulina deusta]|nr:cytochrome c/c1 heme-lyase [Ustulina deusta]